MSSEARQHTIEVSHLSKQYRLGEARVPYGSLRESLTEVGRLPLRLLRGEISRRPRQLIWALRDVSFCVDAGEAVGVIGRNGAGKTTLLKLLSRITEPTAGEADLFGRVASLLEVGTGFHPELTGRENIFLNGAILGMKRQEILGRFDEIVEFGEVGAFLDTPVKHYSSGMYVRLAFAVAAHLQPEILLLDEVLAVGDLHFQKRCLGKIESAAREGRTVLFVSHNMAAVQGLCSRTLWLDKGVVVEDGVTAEVVTHYVASTGSTDHVRVWDDPGAAPGNEYVRLLRASVRAVDSRPGDPISVRQPVTLTFDYENLIDHAYLNPSLHVYNQEGVKIFNTFPTAEADWHGRPFPKGVFRSTCTVPGDLLNAGLHRVQLLLVHDQSRVVLNVEDVLSFEVIDSPDLRGSWHGRWEGAIRPILEWQTQLIAAANGP